MIDERNKGASGADNHLRGGCLVAAAVVWTLAMASPGWAAVGIDVTTSRNQTSNSTTVTSPAFSTAVGNELLLAFISTDHIAGANTTVTGITGGGLTWVLVVRTNVQRGTSEIWRAFAPSPLSNVSITATMSQAVQSSLTVMSFTDVDTSGTNGSGAIGAIGSANSASGAPSATLLTTRNYSMVFGVGNDYDNAIARTLGPGQTLIHQHLTSVGDTYWVQRRTQHTPASGTSVTINDTAPATDRYNLSIVEVLSSPGTQTWTISGTVSPAVAGNATHLFIGGALVSTYADSAGNYTFTGMPNGTYTITPSKPGYTFTPVNRTVTVNGGNVTGLDFTAQGVPTSWSMSGAISPAAGGSYALVTVDSGGTPLMQSADSSGRFTFNGLANGTYNVTPSKPGYTFTPLSQSVTINGADVLGVNFTTQALPTTYSMSGTISPAAGGSGATLVIAGALLTTTADGAGNFSFTGLANGTYTVTPSKTGYAFSPPNRSVTINGANVTGVNFTATTVPTSFTISGTITPAAGGSGTYVNLSGGVVLPVIADSSGNYTFTGVPNGTYTVTPTKYGYALSPTSRVVTVSGANLTGVNFTTQAVPTSFSITGTITPAWAGAGVRLTLGEMGDVFADANGNYQFNNVPNGTFTVVPFKAGFSFSPTGHPVTINGANATGIDFTVQATGSWSSPFELGLVAVNMVMLHTGNVLMYSGSFTTSAQERVWDPATGLFTMVPNPYYNLFCSGHSQLADGRILVVGGYAPPNLGAANANIFDPITQTWSALPNMAYRRWYPTSTTLPDGRALISSGAQTCLTCLADVPEIFDPATGQFTTIPSARLGIPYYPFMFVLPDGKIVNAGANEDPAATSTLDLTTGTWTTVDANVKDGHSAAMYEPGKILKSGTAADSGTSGAAAATAYVIDMTQPAPAWRQVASMAFPRAFHNTTLLPDGNVLVTGGGTMLDGYDVSRAIFEAELWSPATETWRTLSRMTIPRLYHSTALLLPDARVLVAGGGNDGPAVNQTRAQIFSPPYLFLGPRPAIATAPAVAPYGSTFTVDTPDAASIARVTLVRPGAVTHSFDEDQRMLSLGFTAGAGTLTIDAPANANLAPPGYYMLFLVNTAGVPSVAAFVQLPAIGADTEPPTPPAGASATGAIGAATITWTASTDNTGVALYNIHRSAAPGFQPSAGNRVGQSTTTSFVNTGVAAGSHYYVVTAEDVAGNISDPSNEASVFVPADTTAPAVNLTAPADQATVTGSITVSASAADDVGVAGVQFMLDGSALGAEVTAPPYSLTWNTTTTSNDAHTLAAVARDASGNTSTDTVTVTVSNTSQTPNGLVAAYGFNEAAGVLHVTDASGQGNTGTISGATRTTAGKFGGALSFNGTSAWVTVADAASLDLTAGMTIEAWVRPSAVSGWRTVVLKEAPSGLAYSLYSGNSASRPAGYVRVPSGDVGVNGTANMVVNTWTHLAVSYDGATLRMFVNGVLVKSQAAAGAVGATTGVLRMGGNAYWGEYFKGIMDEVRIYNRALTAAEIQADMLTPIP